MWFKSYEHFHLLRPQAVRLVLSKKASANGQMDSHIRMQLRPQLAGLMPIKKCCYTCQWLDNADMHKYAKVDQNIPCGSRVMSIFPNC